MFRHHDKDDSSKQKRRRHNDCIHDEQPSPHPMPPFILQQAFLHAPYTFKLVNQIGAMNNTSSTVLNLKNGVYSMRSCPKTQALSLESCLTSYLRALSQKTKRYLYTFFTIIFLYIVTKPKLYLYKFFTTIFPYIFPKPKLYLYKFFTIIFPYIVPKPKLYLYKFFTIIFPYIVPKPQRCRASS